MKRFPSLLFLLVVSMMSCQAQKTAKPITTQKIQSMDVMTPEILWSLGRVGAIGLTQDGSKVIYKVSTPDIEANSFSSAYYSLPVVGGIPTKLDGIEGLVVDKNISPNGKYILTDKATKVNPVNGVDFYPDLAKSTAQIYTQLDYRHWDTWNDGSFNHVYFGSVGGDEKSQKDIMEGEAYDCPQKPFGGSEDYTWSPDGKSIVYVSKKKVGTAAVISTNTDLYQYDIQSRNTTNLTADNPGYDTNPVYSSNGNLAYLSMKTDGYEADKNDIVVLSNGIYTNLTSNWDGTVNSMVWAKNSNDNLYFTAPVDGTVQLFMVDFPGMKKKIPTVHQLTKGEWDVTSIIGETNDMLIVTRTDMNHAAEIFSYHLTNKVWTQLTFTNAKIYDKLATPKVEKRYVTTTDGKQMLVWVILPPNFDPKKQYPTLLYCQGGPQSALSQFFSFRWNFSVMASQGYIIVAPNRRGMPGHGVAWNEQISKDWGGQNMKDYLSAIDAMAKEPYVDKARLGAVGASYGGYSVFYLAGIHEKRFKSFIAHDGAFNLYSMYGSTEEIFFVNYDFGGPYWDEKYKKAYVDFNPISRVNQWDTPIYIIQGGKDYRIPIGQGLEAFSAAQLRGIKSKLLYLPDENHWVIKPQNSLVWQREFFKWLRETL